MENKIDFSRENVLFISNEQIVVDLDENKKETEFKSPKIREKIEPWLTAVFQSEHLSLLVGSGLPIALTAEKSMMPRIKFEGTYKDLIKDKADSEAKKLERGEANFEDDLRIAIELLKGYEIQKHGELNNLKNEINSNIKELLKSVLQNEEIFLEKLSKEENREVEKNSESSEKNKEKKENFLLLEPLAKIGS